MKPCKVCGRRIEPNPATGRRLDAQQATRLCDRCCRAVQRGDLVVEYTVPPTRKTWKGSPRLRQ